MDGVTKISLWCSECRAYHAAERHFPEWKVEHDGDVTIVRAGDAEDAACEWAEQYDCYADYGIVGGVTETVTVTGADGVAVRYRVTGESVPRYAAETIDE